MPESICSRCGTAFLNEAAAEWCTCLCETCTSQVLGVMSRRPYCRLNNQPSRGKCPAFHETRRRHTEAQLDDLIEKIRRA